MDDDREPGMTWTGALLVGLVAGLVAFIPVLGLMLLLR